MGGSRSSFRHGAFEAARMLDVSECAAPLFVSSPDSVHHLPLSLEPYLNVQGREFGKISTNLP